MKNKFYSPTVWLAACFWLLGGISIFANVAGGGTTGANVTLTDNGTTVTLANGIISIVVTKSDASIHTINYTFNNTGSSQTINVLGNGYSGGKFYWENSSDLGPSCTYTLVVNPATNGGNYAEIALTAADVTNVILEAHFSLLRGNSGFYVTPIWIHPTNSNATFSMGECRDNIYSGSIFNWMSVDATRNKLMPVSLGSAIAVDSGPKEVSLWTNGIYAGQYEDKYKYTADYSTLRAWGWSSVGTGGKNVGLWDVAGSAEYMASGPMRRELICHMGTTILNTPHGGHYGFCSDSTYATNEVWAKVCGPHFIYCDNITNTITATNTAAQTLYADALAQADAETAAWPYAWFNNSNYAPASGRGTITGKIAIADTYNPNASASNLWVGVEQQPPTNTTVTYDFQKWYKPYQFWVKTDANGNFTIPNVIAGSNYTLYAFGPGAAGTFQSQNQLGANSPNELNIPASQFGVNVTGGATNNLGTKTWTPLRVGATVFEIGYPDRTGGKFRHGEDWWVGDIGPTATAPSPVWSKFLEFQFDFPSGVNYVVGQSRWTTDWNFIQPVIINNTGAYDPWGNNSPSSSTITFNLSALPATPASLYIATSSSYQGPTIVQVNGNNLAGSTGYDPAWDNGTTGGSDASIRESNHGLFADIRFSVPTNNLHIGQNTIYLQMRKSGYLANHTMYDYLRFEAPGYIPPAPTSARAYAGNNGNLISWPVQPGATSYNILRSTTSGSGYASITNGVIGPVCGSGWNNATYLDTTAANGTPYYYVVRSVNTVGSSTNSPQASATPDAGISTSAPATPTGLTIGSVAHQSATLNWNVVSNANFYIVYRSTLFNNGGGASNVLGTIVLANNVTNAIYTDTSPTDGSIYRYAVAATGAGGTSTNSIPTVAVPKPSPPASLPPSLFATSIISIASYTTNGAVITTNYQQVVTLTWTAVPGAIGYAIYRSTSASGSFVFLQSVSTTTYIDDGLGTNTIYYYRVAALNAAGVSANATDLINPNQAAPTSLTAAATNAQITLAWSTTTGATSYTVKRGTSLGNETTTVVTSYTGTTYTNTGLVNGTTYYYIVTATGAGGTSGNSPEASATPQVAGNGIWLSPANGNWSTATNWTGNSIASGSGNSADFSTLSLPTDLTVTLDSARTISGLIFGDTTATYNWTLAGTNTLTLGASPVINVENQSATISTPLAGTAGLSKAGLGALTLGGATNTFTGGTVVNAGSLALDFTATNSSVNNLIPAANSLTFGGGALQITGNSNAASSQTFASTVLNAGAAVVSAAPISGANVPTVNLGGTTANAGGVVKFVGPATVGAGGGNVASNAIITTTASGTGAFVGGNGAALYNANFATVGLYDLAATVGASSPYTVIGGSQISGFYTTASGATSVAGGNVDVTGNISSWNPQPYLTSIRCNASLGANQTISASGASTILTLSDILVTPNVGAYNVSFNSGGLRPAGGSGTYTGPYVIWQNNTAGELILNSGLGNSKTGAAAYVQAGPGTVYLANTANGYTNQSYLNGGVTLIAGNGSIGPANFGMTVNLNGGTLVANGTFALDNAGANLRPINLLGNGGGLAATAGNILTVDGVIGSAANAGPLTIGIPASGANSNTPALLPGTGAGTANVAVYATGTVILTNANYFTGGTVLQSGTLNINGLFALGGANYGGVTFDGGTLQYVTNFPGNNGSADLTSIGTAGVTLAAGGGAIDLNGNAVTYAGAIGNNGTGALTVKSSLAGGALNLQSGNNYSGPTTVTNTTLFANNASGSATGSGDVLIQNAGILAGNGTLAGSVTVATGGTLLVGNGTDSLTIGNNLTLNSGTTTSLQVQHSPLNNSSVNVGNNLVYGGALVVTNLGGALTNGDSFQLFSAGNFAGAFSSLTLPTLATNLVWNTNALKTAGVLSVATLTPPTISGLFLAGSNLVITGAGGVNGWPYLLLATTNLAAPQWIPVATNQFDADGNFSVTNTLNSGLPTQYFRIKLQ